MFEGGDSSKRTKWDCSDHADAVEDGPFPACGRTLGPPCVVYRISEGVTVGEGSYTNYLTDSNL